VGRLTRALGALVLAACAWLVAADVALGFDGFGDTEVDSTYGQGITFEVEWAGAEPDRLELLLSTPGDDGSFVTPVEPSGASAVHVWDTSAGYLTPNTVITYRWRAVDGETVTVSDEETFRYVDDRPGLDWQSARLGEATVHWYGGSEGQALRFGELTAQGVARAEELLGTRLAGPVDVFVYDTREDFFGALGPGAREWTGAAAYSELRTIFMWLGGGSTSYLEVAMLHEVTHIVFHDATDNPYHEPARWLNEGIATWAERSEADDERAIVELEAGGGGLFAFEAITEQFPIGERGGRLSYAQGASMVDLIVRDHGEEAIAAIAAAYRDGASDAEALEAGTGLAAEDLYASFYAEFGAAAPQAIQPDPIPPSNVDRPAPGSVDRGGVEPGAERPPDDGAPSEEEPTSGGSGEPVEEGMGMLVLLGVAAIVGVGAAVLVARRAAGNAS
jgi:hypothetical protein